MSNLICALSHQKYNFSSLYESRRKKCFAHTEVVLLKYSFQNTTFRFAHFTLKDLLPLKRSFIEFFLCLYKMYKRQLYNFLIPKTQLNSSLLYAFMHLFVSVEYISFYRCLLYFLRTNNNLNKCTFYRKRFFVTMLALLLWLCCRFSCTSFICTM